MSDMQTVLTQPEYCSRSGLWKRGWTDAEIERFLSTPDKEVPNPHYRNGSPMKLYLTDRIVSLETSEAFLRYREKNKGRREASARANKTKRSKLLKRVNGWEIYIPRQNFDDVIQDAIKSYNAIRVDRSEDGFEYQPASADSNKEFLHRITVNFIRHRCSPYERQLDEVAGKVGKNEAYILLNQNMYKKISEIYPELKSECDRQLEEKLRKLAERQLYVQESTLTSAEQTRLLKF